MACGKWGWGHESYDLFRHCKAFCESLCFLLICVVPQRLEENVKEGNLEPREQSVALEAQVPSPCIHPCSFPLPPLGFPLPVFISALPFPQRKDFPSGIPECGTDALRFALCSNKMQGEWLARDSWNGLMEKYFAVKATSNFSYFLLSLKTTQRSWTLLLILTAAVMYQQMCFV